MGLPALAHTPDERRLSLAHLGVPEHALDAALRRGYRSYLNVDPHWPAQTRGSLMWADGTAELRAGLLPLGWLSCSKGGIESVVSPCSRYRVVWMRGTSGTGTTTGRPKSARAHGAEVERMLVRNERLELFDDAVMKAIVLPGSEANEAHIWVLLVHPTRHQLLAELAYPETIRSGVITSFGPRILLDPINRSDVNLSLTRTQTQSSAAVIEVEVRRRR